MMTSNPHSNTVRLEFGDWMKALGIAITLGSVLIGAAVAVYTRLAVVETKVEALKEQVGGVERRLGNRQEKEERSREVGRE